MSTYEEILRLSGPLESDRVLLFDGHSFAYRSFYAIRELTTHAGLPVNAVFGFWRVLLKTLRDYPSAHVAVAFDAGGGTFRHELYPEYKATRKPMPDELGAQLPLIMRLLEALGIPILAEPGVEADDVLASIARRAASEGLFCLIATSDKDMAQVVNERLALLRPSGKRGDPEAGVLDADGVESKYGVRPGQIVDLLSLIGDASDNVPGVPGVGEKTAVRLLQQFGSLDAVLEHAEEVRNARVRENLATHAECARMARRLIALKTDLLPGDVRECCRLRGVNRDALARFFAEVEFAGALSDLGLATPGDLGGGKASSRSAQADGGEKTAQYRTILDEGALDELVERLRTSDAFALDLETTSLDPMHAEIVGIAVSVEAYSGDYIPVGHDGIDAPPQVGLQRALEALRPLIEAENPKLYGQNLKYDLNVLSRYGVRARGIAFDAMIASHLIHPEERRHNLEQIAATYMGHSMLTYEEVAGKGGSFAAVPVALATRYAAEDAEVVQRLRPHLVSAMEEANATRLFEEVEIPLIPVLARMEQCGILIDTSVLAEQGDRLRTELEIVESDLVDIAGEPFNPNSPKQVAEILFGRLGLPVTEKTKTGPSTSARVLAELAIQHPLPGKLMAHRELKKLLTTYIERLPQAVHPVTGRIHTSFHQTSTATGRLSSSEPNLQNIPTRTSVGERIRQAFVAPEGSLLLGADYSQIELRLLAHFSKDERLIEAFRAGADLHRLTAGHVFGIPESEVTARQRDVAKRINFGILYGISPFGLSRELGVPQSDAKAYIERFFSAYPRARAFIDEMVERATARGYAETILGRRRPLPHLTSRNVSRRNFDRRNAVNTPIQGSAADLIKLAMIRIDRWIEEDRPPVKMLLQIHDELIFEVTEADAARLTPVLVEMMETVLPLRLPLEVKTAVGKNWSEL